MNDEIKKLLMDEYFQNESYFFENFQSIAGSELLKVLLYTIKTERYVFLSTDTSLLILKTSKAELEQANNQAILDRSLIDLSKIKSHCYFRLDPLQKVAYIFKNQIFMELLPNKDINFLSYSLSRSEMKGTLKNSDYDSVITPGKNGYILKLFTKNNNLIFDKFFFNAMEQKIPIKIKKTYYSNFRILFSFLVDFLKRRN
jgi:hypothetical protein